MRKTVFSLSAAALAAGLAIGVSAPAHATVLLDLTNFATGDSGPYDLQFVADDISTTLSVEGYQVPAHYFVIDNDVSTGGGSNLLAMSWTYTPAPSGQDASQNTGAFGVNDLRFAGLVAGSYDTFSQTFATVVGHTYDYTFSVTENSAGPDGLRVEATGLAVGAGGVPEPATWAVMLLGFGGLGAVLRHRPRALA